jgi:hypothetical protein
LSTDIVDHYTATLTDPKELEAVVFKLKHAGYKETICKLCSALFYSQKDPPYRHRKVRTNKAAGDEQ